MEITQELQRIENQVPAQQELPLPVNSDQAALQIALAGNRAGNMPVEELKEALRYAVVKVGLRAQNFPTDAEKGLLIAHVVKEYSGRTAAEIRLAFDMAIAGKLNLDHRDVVCYENFSCLYFSSILNAYQKWAAEEYKQLKTEPAELPAPKESLSDQTMEEWLAETKRRVNAGECRMSFIPLPLYEWLKGKGRIKMQVAKIVYATRAAEWRQGELNEAVNQNNSHDNRQALTDFLMMKANGEIGGKEVGIVESIAKKMILFDMLKD